MYGECQKAGPQDALREKYLQRDKEWVESMLKEAKNKSFSNLMKMRFCWIKVQCKMEVGSTIWWQNLSSFSEVPTLKQGGLYFVRNTVSDGGIAGLLYQVLAWDLTVSSVVDRCPWCAGWPGQVCSTLPNFECLLRNTLNCYGWYLYPHYVGRLWARRSRLQIVSTQVPLQCNAC